MVGISVGAIEGNIHWHGLGVMEGISVGAIEGTTLMGTDLASWKGLSSGQQTLALTWRHGKRLGMGNRERALVGTD